MFHSTITIYETERQNSMRIFRTLFQRLRRSFSNNALAKKNPNRNYNAVPEYQQNRSNDKRHRSIPWILRESDISKNDAQETAAKNLIIRFVEWKCFNESFLFCCDAFFYSSHVLSNSLYKKKPDIGGNVGPDRLLSNSQGSYYCSGQSVI